MSQLVGCVISQQKSHCFNGVHSECGAVFEYATSHQLTIFIGFAMLNV